MRSQVRVLVAMGKMPDEKASEDEVERWGQQFDLIARPLTDEEAMALARCFPPDMGFGMGWSLLHMLETAPGWREIAPQINDPGWREDALKRIELEKAIAKEQGSSEK
jgi:hypothetical protein